ncbi:MAG: prefoldin subunit alpha [Candidatus Undinarchaeales archaeon]|jgi:prefoldin alpha subunit|nr:prefoldin subunit alpha [Candidatus Undinarchaeales archaeon]
MTNKQPDNDFQQKYMQYNVCKQQAQGLMKEISVLNQTAQSLSTAKEVLLTVDAAKDKSEVLIPVGGNTFLKAKMDDTNNVLMGVGSDVVLKKSVSDARSSIDEQLANLNSAGDKLAGEMKALEDKMKVLEPELQKRMMEMQKEQKK